MSEIRIGLIIGSTRPGSPGAKVAEWYVKKTAEVSGVTIETIALSDNPLPFLDEPMPPAMGQYQHDHTKAWSAKISQYDAYIWLTPEYNHGTSAALKNAIDFLANEWKRKPVALVGYGSVYGQRAVEQLRTVATELEMMPIRDSVGIRDPWAMFDEKGEIKEELAYGDPVAQIEQLLWWANALKAAR